MRMLIAALCVFAVAGVANAAGAAHDPAADKLFAQARQHEEAAKKDREQAVDFAVKAGNAEAAASREDFEAHVLVARALALEKADANKVKAAELRNQARIAWGEAHVHWTRAHNDIHTAQVDKHDAAELEKAASMLKDQPAVANALRNDEKNRVTLEKRFEDAAKKEETDAKTLDAKARSLWAQAEKLDPETMKRVAAPPAVVHIAPPPPPKPSAAVANAGKK